MAANRENIRRYLREFNFSKLFIEELGWDYHRTRPLEILLDENAYILTSIAQKRGMAIFQCDSNEDNKIPISAVRRKIERRAAKSAHEHIIIYTDKENTIQIWQWVKREKGKPLACRDHTLYSHQSGEELAQRIAYLNVDLEEEADFTIVDAAGRAKQAFDVDKVTKRFYDHYKKEHMAFAKFIEGITQQSDLDWYTSVMLDRLMFIYFIQKKGFIDNDQDYLKNRFNTLKGENKFYQNFLTLLFFEGFAKEENDRTDKINKLLGNVPYLNGGIFTPHDIEVKYGNKIKIPDKAFENIFAFFDQYKWYLDDRPLKAGDEINPDVLGYIFEKYVNQKQMGAYYTKEDITEYISKSTIIPFLFDAAKKKCPIAFQKESYIWSLLGADPDRYIYPAVKKGVSMPLPDDIAVGLSDVSKRTNWNKLALEEFALPTEIWREVVARRQRYEKVRSKLTSGEITSINDFITYNLDIRQFAQDVIENCEGPELLRALYNAIEKITVLDPTCGSGAFLFAALNILEPLYEACLDRMQAFLDDLERSGKKHRPEKFSDFRKILRRIEEHPNRKYFVLKSIIINNLYGVDIMDEAVEIAKLRFFLKLMAQIDKVENIEPLPDIDFNIKAGNTLVGFSSYDEVNKYVSSKFDFDNVMVSIEKKAEEIDRLFTLFRNMQTEEGMKAKDFAKAKQRLQIKLIKLEEELNGYLAGEYGVNLGKKRDYDTWLSSYKPFHWYIEFYSIINSNGFDVIIGNPPYVEYSKIKNEYALKNYETEKCGNLYAFVIEKCTKICSRIGYISFIVPVSAFSTKRMIEVQNVLNAKMEDIYLSHFSGDRNPAELFTGVKNRLSIFTGKCGVNNDTKTNSSKYMKWFTEARPQLFSQLSYINTTNFNIISSSPKIGEEFCSSILSKISSFSNNLNSYFRRLPSKFKVIYHNTPIHWTRAFNFEPYFWNEREGKKLSTQMNTKYVLDEEHQMLIVAILNSSLFFWFWLVYSDCYHLIDREFGQFKFDIEGITDKNKTTLIAICKELMDDYQQKSKMKKANYKTTGLVKYEEIDPKQSKDLIDKIDRVLARHYKFSTEETDYIINYDVKYRMGKDNL